MAFWRWQEHRLNVEKRKEYRVLCKRVQQALRVDKEKWIEEEMKEMEEDIRRHRHGNFFRRMRKLTNSRVIPTNTILDEKGQTIRNPEETLARWQRHFAEVLNVQKKAAEEVLSELEDHSHGETDEVSKKEVEKAVGKLCNGKAAGQDEAVAELLKYGGEVVIDWLTEEIQQVWRSGKIPQEWKDATLIPVHKKWARNECNNYITLECSWEGAGSGTTGEDASNSGFQLLEAQCGFRKVAAQWTKSGWHDKWLKGQRNITPQCTSVSWTSSKPTTGLKETGQNEEETTYLAQRNVGAQNKQDRIEQSGATKISVYMCASVPQVQYVRLEKWFPVLTTYIP